MGGPPDISQCFPLPFYGLLCLAVWLCSICYFRSISHAVNHPSFAGKFLSFRAETWCAQALPACHTFREFRYSSLRNGSCSFHTAKVAFLFPTHTVSHYLSTSLAFSQAHTCTHILNDARFKMESLGGKTIWRPTWKQRMLNKLVNKWKYRVERYILWRLIWR